MNPEESLKRTRLPERNLDVLRAIAVSLVVGMHLMLAFHHDARVWQDLARGGVLLFFVHTSLVLMSSMERGGSAPGWVSTFYLRRAFRIYPLAIFAVLLVVASRMPFNVPQIHRVSVYTAPTAIELVTNLTLTQNLFRTRDLLGVLWSLPLEVQMYLVLPACFVVARRSLRAALGLFIGSYALAALWRAHAIPDANRLTLLAFGPCFVAGVVAYAVIRHHQIRRSLPGWTFPCLLLLSMLPLAIPGADEHITVVGWIVALPLAFSVPAARELPSTWLTRGAKTVAKYSYGIYLLHVPALWFGIVVCRSLPMAAQLSIALALGIALPVLGYHTIEAPAIGFGSRLAHGRQAAAAAVPAP